MTALPPYLKRGDFHCCYVYLLLSLPSLNHPAQLIVVASVYLIMAERHVLRHGTSWRTLSPLAPITARQPLSLRCSAYSSGDGR
jgi:hypothetical protein